MSINNLTQLGNTVGSSYNQFNQGNPNSNIYQSNNNSTQTIVNNLNSELAISTNSSSLLGLLSNINQENLVKNDQYIKMQNEDLTKQLRNLESIQSNIENKNRIIDQINFNIQNQQTNINILIVSIIFTIIFFGLLMSYKYNRIEFSRFIFILICLFVLYTCYIMYQYNIFYIQTSLNALFSNNVPLRLSNAVSDLQNIVESQLQEDIYGPESTWINNNCSCPTVNNHSVVYPDVSGVVSEETQGYYYYDGSAPAQLLVPTPTSPPLDGNIQWVDYDNLQNNNTTYYNYNTNNTDPDMVLINELNSLNANMFVGNTTITGNM